MKASSVERMSDDRPRSRAGIAARFSGPLDSGRSSNRTWNWPMTISTPMPASIPWTTAGEIALNQPPSRNTPAPNWISPARTRMGPSAVMP